MNISAVHSWKAIKKCLKETKKLPRASYPLGNTSQFSKPVLHKIIKRIKEITLTIQSFEDLPLDIHYPSINSVIYGGWFSQGNAQSWEKLSFVRLLSLEWIPDTLRVSFSDKPCDIQWFQVRFEVPRALGFLATIKLLPKLTVSNEYHRSFASAESAGYIITLYFCLF